MDNPSSKYVAGGYYQPIYGGNYQLGDTGGEVCWIQTFLWAKYGTIGCDGIFGSDTENHVIRYQKEKGLNPDGIVGINTGTTMYNEWREMTKTVTIYYKYRTGTKWYTYSREVAGSWSNWSTTVPSGSNIKVEDRYKY